MGPSALQHLCADLKETLSRKFHLSDAGRSSTTADSLVLTDWKLQNLVQNITELSLTESSRDPGTSPALLPLLAFEEL